MKHFRKELKWNSLVIKITIVQGFILINKLEIILNTFVQMTSFLHTLLCISNMDYCIYINVIYSLISKRTIIWIDIYFIFFIWIDRKNNIVIKLHFSRKAEEIKIIFLYSSVRNYFILESKKLSVDRLTQRSYSIVTLLNFIFNQGGNMKTKLIFLPLTIKSKI